MIFTIAVFEQSLTWPQQHRYMVDQYITADSKVLSAQSSPRNRGSLPAVMELDLLRWNRISWRCIIGYAIDKHKIIINLSKGE